MARDESRGRPEQLGRSLMSRERAHRLGLAPTLRPRTACPIVERTLVACATAPAGAELADVQALLERAEQQAPAATRWALALLWGEGLVEMPGVMVTAAGWAELARMCAGRSAA